MLRHHRKLRALVLIFRSFYAERKNSAGITSRKLKHTLRQRTAVYEGIMLPGIQYVTLPCSLDDEPIFEAHVVIRQQLQLVAENAVGTGLGKTWEWRYDVAGFIDDTFVGESLPFEAAVFQLQPVAFVGDAGGFVNAVLIGTSKQ